MKYNPNDYPDNGENYSNFLPVGKHTVQVFEHETGFSGGGHEQVIVNVRDRQGRTRKAWLICEGKAGFQFAALLRACDWHQSVDTDSGLEMRRAIYGKDVQVVVAEETYNGKTEPRIKYFNKIAGGKKNGSAEPESPPPMEEPPPRVDDDIPF